MDPCHRVPVSTMSREQRQQASKRKLARRDRGGQVRRGVGERQPACPSGRPIGGPTSPRSGPRSSRFAAGPSIRPSAGCPTSVAWATDADRQRSPRAPDPSRSGWRRCGPILADMMAISEFAGLEERITELEEQVRVRHEGSTGSRGLRPRRRPVAAEVTDRSPWDWYAESCSCGLPPGECRAHPRARTSQRPPAGDWRVWALCGRARGGQDAGRRLLDPAPRRDRHHEARLPDRPDRGRHPRRDGRGPLGPARGRATVVPASVRTVEAPRLPGPTAPARSA